VLENLAVSILLVLSTSLASAQTKAGYNMTAFGFQLGEKFGVRECERDPFDGHDLLKKMHAGNVERMKQSGMPETEDANARFSSQLKEYEKQIYAVGEHSSACFQWPDMINEYVSVDTPLVTAKVKIDLPVDQAPMVAMGPRNATSLELPSHIPST
jgi:hypothetical protein